MSYTPVFQGPMRHRSCRQLHCGTVRPFKGFASIYILINYSVQCFHNIAGDPENQFYLNRNQKRKILFIRPSDFIYFILFSTIFWCSNFSQSFGFYCIQAWDQKATMKLLSKRTKFQISSEHWGLFCHSGSSHDEQNWQYWHYCQLCVPIYLQFSNIWC